MAAEAEELEENPRRKLPVAVAITGLVVVAGSGLFVAFRPGPGTIQEEASVQGERLSATLVVRLQDEAVTDADATVVVTNDSDRPAYYSGSECSGPGQPWIGPEGARAAQAGEVATNGLLRDRLIAAGSASRIVSLYPSSDPACDADEGVVAVAPHESVTFEYHSNNDPVDRSSELRGVAALTEVTRRGRELGRLRLIVPLAAADGADRATVDQAVDAFLADAQVIEFLADAEDGVLAHVAPEDDGWRISVSASSGHLAADVGADLFVRVSG
jgi:hypothetical protein